MSLNSAVTRITVDMLQPNIAAHVYAVSTDQLVRRVEATLVAGGAPYNLPVEDETGPFVMIRYLKPDGTKGYYNTLEDSSRAYSYSGNVFNFGLAAQMLTVPGVVQVEVQFFTTYGAGVVQRLTSFKFLLHVSAEVASDGAISEDYYNFINVVLAEAQQDLAEMRAYVGAPRVAATAAAMTDHSLIYVYTGSETGYTAGNWYYWDGSAWASGGIYNAAAVSTDTTLSVAGKAADAKATGDAIRELQNEVGYVELSLGTRSAGYFGGNSGATLSFTSNSNSSAYTVDLSSYVGKTVMVELTSPDSGSTRTIALGTSGGPGTAVIGQKFIEKNFANGTYANGVVTVTPTATNNTLYISFLDSSSHPGGARVRVLEAIIADVNALKSEVFPATVYVDGSVATSGDGTSASPYKTIAEGVASGAETVLVKEGTYAPFVVSGRTRPLKIMLWDMPNPYSTAVPDVKKIKINATGNQNCVRINGATEVYLSDIHAHGEMSGGVGAHLFMLWNIKAATLVRCYAEGDADENTTVDPDDDANDIMGFGCRNSNISFVGCKAWNIRRDGFNFHAYGNYDLSDCEATVCHDDGVSHHDGCTGTIRGGEFSHCTKGGVASPTYGATVDVINVYSHDNKYGIYSLSGPDKNASKGRIVGCVLKGNDTADILATKTTLVGWNNIYSTTAIDASATFTEITA